MTEVFEEDVKAGLRKDSKRRVPRPISRAGAPSNLTSSEMQNS